MRRRRLRAERRPSPATPVLPLINIAFLLLVFFLLAGRLADPAPFPVTLPTAMTAADRQGDAAGSAATVATAHIAADGTVAWNGEAMPSVAAIAVPATLRTLRIEADRASPAGLSLELIEHARAAGVATVHLVTSPVGVEEGR